MIKMKIQKRNAEITEAELEVVTRHLDMALDRLQHSFSELQVTLTDVNGPRGGIDDKKCRVRFQMPGRGLFVVEGAGSSFAYAAHAAGEKVGSVVAKQIHRRTRKSRKMLA